MDEKLLALPWHIQVALASGYLAYMLAYAGLRDHHKPVDTAFRAIAFGLVASAVLFVAPRDHPILSSLAAVALTVGAGVIWRLVGILATRQTLRALDVSWADDAPSAWATITASNSRYLVSQISVLTDDGVWLHCDQAGPFADDPFGPVVFGPNGDIGLYVTSEQKDDASAPLPHNAVRAEGFGSRLTYVPASRVKRVAIRHLPPEPSAVRRWWRRWRS